MRKDSERNGSATLARRGLAEYRWLVVALSGALFVSGFIAGRLPAPQVTAGFALLTAAAAVAGLLIARGTFDGIRRGQVTMEMLVATATVGALALGDFFSAAGVSFLFVSGAALEARWPRSPHDDLRQSGAADAAEHMNALNAAAGARSPGRIAGAFAFFTCWFTPMIIALSAGALVLTDDAPFALALLLVASPRAVLAAASPVGAPAVMLRDLALALLLTIALLGAVLAGAIGMVGAMAIQQASVLLALHCAARRTRA